jgi:hypothetical protein
MRLALIAAVAVVIVVSLGAAQTNRDDQVVAQATAYVVDFLGRFSNVVAEERYIQQTTSPRRRRELKSDFLLVKPPGSNEWFQFRDVFEVDGAPVRDRDERLAKLFLDEPRNALARADEVTREASRFNLESSMGTVNKPLLVIGYLQPRYVARFRFTVGPIDRSVGAGVRLVQFSEWARPTILHKAGANADLPAHGRIWIEEGTGRVVKTELRAGEAEIITTFAFDDNLQVAVPVEMRERYLRLFEITGVATYGRFRRFEVRTEEEIRVGPAPPAPPTG